jgi:hypothetical protein
MGFRGGTTDFLTGGENGTLDIQVWGKDMTRVSRIPKDKRGEKKKQPTVPVVFHPGVAGRSELTCLFPTGTVGYWGDQISVSSSSQNLNLVMFTEQCITCSQRHVPHSRWMIVFPSSVEFVPIPKILGILTTSFPWPISVSQPVVLLPPFRLVLPLGCWDPSGWGMSVLNIGVVRLRCVRCPLEFECDTLCVPTPKQCSLSSLIGR